MSDTRQYPTSLLALFASLIVLGVALTTDALYAYGVSNHNSQIPPMRHMIDGTYLATDWYVSTQLGFDNPRFYYYRLVSTIGEVIGIDVAIHVIYAVTAVAMLWSLWTLSNRLFGDRLVTLVVLAFFLSDVTNVINIGGNILFRHILIPSFLANTLVLFAFTRLLRGHYRTTFGLLGVATLFHVITGVWMGIVAGLCVVAIEAGESLRERRYTDAVRAIPWDAALLYGAISLLSVGPIALANLGSGPSTTHIHAWIRNPHHLSLSYMWGPELLGTLTLCVFGIALLYWYGSDLFTDASAVRLVAVWVGSLSLLFVLGGVVFVELYPLDPVVKLQVFHLDDYLLFVVVGVIAKVAVLRSRGYFEETGRDPATATMLGAILLGAVVVLVGSLVLIPAAEQSETDFERDLIEMGPHLDDDLRETYTWIEHNTPRDGIFLTPPGRINFRMETGRAQVVDFKSYPHVPEHMIEWERRMADVCAVDSLSSLDGAGFDLVAPCDRRFNHLPREQIDTLSDRYEADYVLTRNGDLDLDVVFTTDSYYVYAVE